MATKNDFEEKYGLKVKDRSNSVTKGIAVVWIGVLCLLLLMAGVVFSISKGWWGELPPLSDLQNPIDKYASRVYSDDGEMLGTWSYASENRVLVSYDSLPDNLVKALVSTEDVRFYDHSGIDLRAFARAVIKRGIMRDKSAGGGSTITQQLAKQLYSEATQDTHKRLMQKPIEWYIAIQLERNYTKEEIITMYLNYFDFLYSAVGIKNAANVYFGKEPKDLNLSECATLVGMCKNPSYYNPKLFPERSKERRNVVLGQMVKAGFIDKSEKDALVNTDINLEKFHVTDHKEGIAPYFREYLRRVLMANKPVRGNYASWQDQQFYEDSLAWEQDPVYGWCNKNTKKNGKNYNIYTDGLKIYTTIDSRMQQYAEEAMFQHVAKTLQPIFNAEKRNAPNGPYSKVSAKQVKASLERAMRQTDRYRKMKADGCSDEEIEQAFNTKVPMVLFSYDGPVETQMTPMDSIKYYKMFLRSGFMCMDPKSGYVKAYVAGLTFKYFQYDNVMGGGRRQVGSTIKPYLYSLAMENGYTPCDVAPNVQRSYRVAGKLWTPRNGSHARYGQMVTLKWGLSQSNNWIAAYVMSQLNPVQLVNLMHNMGIRNKNINPSISLCLGPCDVSVGEMVSAYTAFPNAGVRYAPLLISRIEDSDGNVVQEFTPQMNEVMSSSSAYKMISMLRAVIDEGTGKRLRSKYGFTADICGKTGTTNDNSDGWFMGFTPRLVAGCWVGGDERTIHFNSTANGQGAAAALPIWALFMKKVYADKSLGYSQDEKFDIPEDFDLCESELDGLSDSAPVATKPVEEREEGTGSFDEMFQ